MVWEFVCMSCKEVGIEVVFSGEGVNEIVIIIVVDNFIVLGVKVGDVIVKVDLCYFCLVEVDMLLGDFIKVKKKLGWELEISVEDMCVEMVVFDFYKVC